MKNTFCLKIQGTFASALSSANTMGLEADGPQTDAHVHWRENLHKVLFKQMINVQEISKFTKILVEKLHVLIWPQYNCLFRGRDRILGDKPLLRIGSKNGFGVTYMRYHMCYIELTKLGQVINWLSGEGRNCVYVFFSFVTFRLRRQQVDMTHAWRSNKQPIPSIKFFWRRSPTASGYSHATVLATAATAGSQSSLMWSYNGTRNLADWWELQFHPGKHRVGPRISMVNG